MFLLTIFLAHSVDVYASCSDANRLATWVQLFQSGNPQADSNGDTVLSGADYNAYINLNCPSLESRTNSIPVNFLSPGHEGPYSELLGVSNRCPEGSEPVEIIEKRSAPGFAFYDMPLIACMASANDSGGFTIPESGSDQDVLYFGGAFGQYKDYDTPKPNPIGGDPLWHPNPYTGTATCDTSKGFEVFNLQGFKGSDWAINVCFAKKSASDEAPYPDKKFHGFSKNQNGCSQGQAKMIHGTVGSPHFNDGTNMDESLYICVEDVTDNPNNGEGVQIASLSLLGLDSYDQDEEASLVATLQNGSEISKDTAFAFTIGANVSVDGQLVDSNYPHDLNGDGQISSDETPVNPSFRVRFTYEKTSGEPLNRPTPVVQSFAPYTIGTSQEYGDGSQRFFFWARGDRSVGTYVVTATPIEINSNTAIGDSVSVSFSITGDDDGNNNSDDLTAPTGLTGSNVSTNAFRLNWDAVSGAASYKVYLNESQNNTSSDTTSNISGLSADTPYSVAVRAVDANGNDGPLSAAITVRTDEDDNNSDDNNVDPNLDTEGWSILEPSSDSLMVHVSTSGNDNNPGTVAQPIRTLEEAKQRVRDGKPDWILLKRGDTWRDEHFGNWEKGGRSRDEKMVITSYGTGPRPKIYPAIWDRTDSDGNYLDTNNRTFLRFKTYTASGNKIAHVAVRDLDVEAQVVAGKGVGIEATMNFGNETTHGTLEDVLIEGNKLSGFFHNMTIQSQKVVSGLEPKDIFIRRNIIKDARGGSHAQGIFANGIRNLVIQQNVIYRNAWDVNRGRDATATIFAHCVYIQRLDSFIHTLTFEENFVADCGSHALQARDGGVIANNFAVDNPIGLQSGNENDENKEKPAYTEFVDNVIMDGIDQNSGQRRGWHLVVQGLRASASGERSLIANNIMSDTLGRGSQPRGISVGGKAQYDTQLKNVEFRGNIVNDLPGLNVGDGAILFDDVIFRLNRFITGDLGVFDISAQNWAATYIDNKYSGTQDLPPSQGWTEFNPNDPSEGFVDRSRNLDSYAEMVLGAGKDREDFYREITNLQRGNWDESLTAPAINDYIREGFGR